MSASAESLIRSMVVAGVTARQLSGLERSAAVRAAAKLAYAFAGSVRTVSERSLWRWLAAFDAKGTGCLETAERPSPGCQVLNAVSVRARSGTK